MNYDIDLISIDANPELEGCKRSLFGHVRLHQSRRGLEGIKSPPSQK
jgi:hypothetical protein